jgi:hypothetical protein
MPQDDFFGDEPEERILPKKTVADLSKEDRATIRTGSDAQAFLDSSFGKGYLTVLRTMIENQRLAQEQPTDPSLDGVAQAIRNGEQKGTIVGLRLALEIIPGMVESAKQVKRARGLSLDAGEDI